MHPARRVLVAVLLVVSLGVQVLPFGSADLAPAVSGERSGRTVTIEPLQVCGQGDAALGVLFDLPVLVPGAPGLFPAPVMLRRLPDTGAFIPDGFHPAIDHPPQLSA